jgi:hypothetical protein
LALKPAVGFGLSNKILLFSFVQLS